MGRKLISLQGDLFKEYIERLDELGGSSAMKKGVEKALTKSKEYVNGNLDKAMGKLPAGGKYSTGKTRESIDKDTNVKWEAFLGEIKVGFDFKKSGLTSIFLMYGTPKMSPVNGLKNAIYGTATQRHITKLQGDELDKVVKRIMEGK